MESREEKAIRLFRSGMNCAQSVAITLAGEQEGSEDFLGRAATGFGAGMGRLQETCGAATGAFMAIGIYASARFTDNNDRKTEAYSLIQTFEQKFKELNGSLKCRELIGCDLRTEEGRKYAHENKLFDTICEKCVQDAVRITEELLKV